MNTRKLLLSSFFFIALQSSPVSALNTTGIQQCASFFYMCTADLLASNVTNSSYFNCTEPFKGCLSEFAYLIATKSEECFLADSAWENLYIAIPFSVGVFLFSNILWPAMLKGGAKYITKISKYDPEEHSCLSYIGKKFKYFTDADGDGVVTASELVTPQTIFAFASVNLPVYQWFLANDAQAKCNYQNSLPLH